MYSLYSSGKKLDSPVNLVYSLVKYEVVLVVLLLKYLLCHSIPNVEYRSK